VTHLGDNQTGAGEGDDESLTIDLDRVHGPVDTIVLLVSSYQGHSLEWIHRAYCRITDEHDAELATYRLTGGVSQTGLVLATLKRAEAAWTLRAVGEGVAITVPTQGLAKLNPYVS
jgi:stress response protein SCP2